ncbi:J domain-containing protein [Nanoarchaeota archaeon]
MTDLIHLDGLSGLTSGIPDDINPMHNPWAYYEILGVARDSSSDKIKKAYRDLSKKLHPDNPETGDKTKFKTITRIYNLLSHDGGQLGPEYSKRKHYDTICTLEDLFDSFIEYEGDRTKKVSELKLKELEFKTKQAEFLQEMNDYDPRFSELQQRLQELLIMDDPPEKEFINITQEIDGIITAVKGENPELAKQHMEMMEENFKDKMRELNLFNIMFNEDPESWFYKILDVIHLGEGTVTFGYEAKNEGLNLMGVNNRKGILELMLGGNSNIRGFFNVHFKADQADVKVYNASLNGIFHIINGNVDVNFPYSTYKNVIRARAPEINYTGFVKEGDLFVPEKYATDNWQERKPTLDIAVLDGKINLNLSRTLFEYAGGILSRGREYLRKENK